jgi:hypothetical protein
VTQPRAGKLLLGTLFVVGALATAAAVAPRAWGQEGAKPKPPADGDSSPSDKAPSKEKAAPAPLPEGVIRRLGPRSGPPSREDGGIQALAFSPDGTRLASRAEEPEKVPCIRLWNVADGKEALAIDGDGLVLFTLDGRQLLGRSSPDAKEDEVVLWDAASGETRARIPAADLKFARMLPDGKQCVIVYGRAEAAYVDLTTGKITRTVVAQWGTPLGLSRDGARLLSVRGAANRDLKQGATPLYLADTSTGRDDLAQFQGKQGAVTTGMADFSPEPLASENRLGEDRVLAAGGWDNSVHVWELKSPFRLLMTLKGHTDRVLRVVFSNDARFVVSVGKDQTTRIWDLLTGQELAQLAGHAEYATAVAFSPDGRLLATGGNFRDRTILLWDFWKVVLGSPEPLASPTDAQLQTLWNTLTSDAPGAGPLGAVGALATAPADALRFVRRQIDPYVQEAQRDRILELIKQLDDGQFAVREAATEALIRLRRQAEGILRTALRETHSPEVHFRLRRILSQGNAMPSISAAEVRRYRRAVLLLERIAGAEAQKLLEHLSEVFPSPDVNRDAREALARLRRS